MDTPALPASIRVEPSDSVMRRLAAWRGMSAEMVHVTRPRPVELHIAAPVHLLIAYEHGLRQQGETRVLGGATSTLKNLRRKLTFVPAGREFREWLVPNSAIQFMCLYIEPSEQVGLPGGGDASRLLAPRLLFENRVLWETISKLKGLIESGVTNWRYLEAVGAVLAHELSQIMSGQTSAERPARGGLAAWQVRLVTDYIEEHLSEDISLTTLAGLVRLSPHHFCRAFRQSLGRSPCRYHGMRRLDQAKRLLASPNLTISDIALQSGFNETSTFSAAFRRATGVPPTTFRRSPSWPCSPPM
jgi:AraC family transcriptional regulator